MTNAVIISVEYGDILELTLPYNLPFFTDCVVVTTEADTKTIEVCQQNNVRCHCTDIFYRRRAVFNKFAAVEEGLNVIGKRDWMLVLDADILIPRRRPPFEPKVGNIYTPVRRIWNPIPSSVPEERLWRTKRPTMAREEFNGYFQLFHADDPVLKDKQEWYETDWTWAGGADTFFHRRWHVGKKVRPPFEVLHLGPPFKNWAGRVSPFIDGTVPEKAQERSEITAMILANRRTKREGGRYVKEKLE